MRTRMIMLLLLTTACGASAQPAQARQQPLMPEAEVIEGMMRNQDLRLPGEGELRRAAPSMPNLEALPSVPSTAKSDARAPDLGELARQYERMGVGLPSGPSRAERPAAGLLVFVSLAMPRPSLEMLVADAERAGATLVLRGVAQRSLKATKAAIQQFTGKRRVSWQIDPSLYRAFGVEAVPTYVVMKPGQPVQRCGQDGADGRAELGGEGAQCGLPTHARVTGDVTLRRALQAMSQGDPNAKRLAAPYLQRLEGGAP